MNKDPVCKPDCPGRSDICHSICQEYLEEFQKNREKVSQDRICNEYRQAYKDAQAKRDYRSNYQWRKKR